MRMAQAMAMRTFADLICRAVRGIDRLQQRAHVLRRAVVTESNLPVAMEVQEAVGGCVLLCERQQRRLRRVEVDDSHVQSAAEERQHLQNRKERVQIMPWRLPRPPGDVADDWQC